MKWINESTIGKVIAIIGLVITIGAGFTWKGNTDTKIAVLEKDLDKTELAIQQINTNVELINKQLSEMNLGINSRLDKIETRMEK